MGFIKHALKDVKEGEAVEEGEYDLTITKADEGVSKAGNDMVTVTLRIDDAPIPNPNLIRHWLVQPAEGGKDSQIQLLNIKRFLTLFGIPTDGDGFDTEDLIGQTARCLVKQEEGDDDQVYNRLVLPRLRK